MSDDNRSRRRVPLSLEELRQRREDAAVRQNKLTFVPRAERKQLFGRDAADGAESSEPNPHRTAPKRPRSPSHAQELEDTAERAAIRQHYMHEQEGIKIGRTRTSRSTSEKNRFRFDWDPGEDTLVAASADRTYARLMSESHAASALSRRRCDRAVDFGKSIISPSKDDISIETPSHRPFGLPSSTNGNGQRHRASHDARHWSKKGREEMTMRDWAIFREDFSITMRGGSSEAAKPARNWNETGLPGDLLILIRDAGYMEPTPIQMCAIPVGLRMQDLIGLAETGSGKTAAFVLPMLVHIRSLPKLSASIAANGPYALVLAPTRELVLQIQTEMRKFASPLGYHVAAVIGGQSLEEQGLALQSGCEIVVCTPGRMGDLLSRQLAVLGNCNYLILDEADRMIDMGFEPQVQEILSAMPESVVSKSSAPSSSSGITVNANASSRRHTVMFSATMSPTVERLARDYLVKPIVLTIGEAGKAADAVDQRVEFLTSEGKKRERLVNLVRELDPPIIVFVNTKKGCEDVGRLLESGCGLRPSVLHSGKSQEQREQILSNFKAGRVDVVVATDLLGRGIDIKGVNHVVNFELPSEMAKYTHRIGRTGRAGRKGVAWSLATAADSELFGDLKVFLEQSGSRVCPAIARHSTGRHTLRHIVD